MAHLISAIKSYPTAFAAGVKTFFPQVTAAKVALGGAGGFTSAIAHQMLVGREVQPNEKRFHGTTSERAPWEEGQAVKVKNRLCVTKNKQKATAYAEGGAISTDRLGNEEESSPRVYTLSPVKPAREYRNIHGHWYFPDTTQLNVVDVQDVPSSRVAKSYGKLMESIRHMP